jgi:hypothetical protein
MAALALPALERIQRAFFNELILQEIKNQKDEKNDFEKLAGFMLCLWRNVFD